MWEMEDDALKSLILVQLAQEVKCLSFQRDVGQIIQQIPLMLKVHGT